MCFALLSGRMPTTALDIGSLQLPLHDLQVEGSGFLYKQVRHMAGVLISIGQGSMTLEALVHLLEMGSSQAPGEEGHCSSKN